MYKFIIYLLLNLLFIYLLNQQMYKFIIYLLLNLLFIYLLNQQMYKFIIKPTNLQYIKITGCIVK
jgi:hypothetical protein